MRTLITGLFILVSVSLFAQRPLALDSEVSVEVTDGTLYGTLIIPENDGPVPVVLIIPGSGPTDRDCNSSVGLRTDAFKQLAYALAEKGIASLRVDKRISGKSAASFAEANKNIRFQNFIDDVGTWVDYLKNYDRLSKVVVAGHSQGSLTGMIASQTHKADMYISISGAGRSVLDLMQEQLIAAVPAQEAEIVTFMDSLRKDEYQKDAPLFLTMTVPESIAPFIREYGSWDPSKEIAKLSCPVLIINGENDIQIPPGDAELLHKALPASEIAIIPEMNHVLKNAPADREANMATYNDPLLEINPGLVEIIANFVLR